MATKKPINSTGRWHRPKVYGTIVAMYFLILGVAGAILLGIGMEAITSEWYLVIIIGIYMAFPVLSILAGIRLLRETEGEYESVFQYGMLVLWSLVSVGVFLSFLINSSGDIEWYDYARISIIIAMWAANILMYIFLYKWYQAAQSEYKICGFCSAFFRDEDEIRLHRKVTGH